MELEKTIAQNRNEWLVYAYNVLKMSFEEISKQVGLAKSTVQNYIRYKYSNLLDKAKKIFNKFFRKPKRNYSKAIQTNNIDLLDNAKEKCYLFRFYDTNNNLVCSKVGTTTRKVTQRLKEELRSKTYSSCEYAVIDRVYDCGEMPAEGLESRIRAEYIRKYPNSFKKNDRFIKTLFDLEEIDKIVQNYLQIA